MADVGPVDGNGFPSGLGNAAQATQATAAMRNQPWYKAWLAQNGVQSGAGDQVKLNDQQRASLMATMLKNGVGLNHKYDSVDENGQIAEEHHKVKKVAIAAAIAGLALTGFGAAGIGPLAGALGGASAASAGGAAAASGLAEGGAAVGGGLAAGEVTAGALEGGLLASSAIPAVAGIGSLVPATVGTGAAISGTTAAGVGLGGSTLSRATSLMSKGQRANDLLDAAGSGLGKAATAAGNNRLTAGQLLLLAQKSANETANTNTTGQSAYENELMARAKEEQLQRSDALKNVYRQSYAANRTAGPFNARGLTSYSPEYMAALHDLTTQGSTKLAKTPQYDTNGMPVLPPYKPVAPIDPTQFMDQYGQPSTLEKTANWLSPTLSVAGKIAGYYFG